jgi:hypothetical protein
LSRSPAGAQRSAASVTGRDAARQGENATFFDRTIIVVPY